MRTLFETMNIRVGFEEVSILNNKVEKIKYVLRLKRENI
jgi:hypothetical protein